MGIWQAKAAAEVGRNGAVPGYLWPMLRNPGRARPTQIIGEYLNREGKLPPKLTQMAIPMVSRPKMYNGSWTEHPAMAERAGLPMGSAPSVRPAPPNSPGTTAR